MSTNRALVFEDRVNIATCPLCAFEARVNAPLMCTNVPRQFAVWFEPQRTTLVDEMTAQFAQAMGSGSFYATAPRIADWEEFKAIIEKFENGELKGRAASFNLDALRRITAASAPKTSFLDRLFGKK